MHNYYLCVNKMLISLISHNSYIRKIAIFLIIIKTVAHYKFVSYHIANIIGVNVSLSSGGFVQQSANFQTRWVTAFKKFFKLVKRQTCIYDIFNYYYMATGNICSDVADNIDDSC